MASSARENGRGGSREGTSRISLGTTQQPADVYGHGYYHRGVELSEHVEASALGRGIGYGRFPYIKR